MQSEICIIESVTSFCKPNMSKIQLRAYLLCPGVHDRSADTIKSCILNLRQGLHSAMQVLTTSHPLLLQKIQLNIPFSHQQA